MKTRISLFINVEDVVLNTSEIFINDYCKKHNINKTFYDLKDDKFKSIDRHMDIDIYNAFMMSQECYDSLNINNNFLDFIHKNIDNFYWIFIVSDDVKGDLQKDFLINNLPMSDKIDFFTSDDVFNFKYLDMSNGYQIDTHYKNLNTNAKIKFLLKNNIETNYNQVKYYRDDLYIVNDITDFINSVKFFDIERI